MPHYAKWASHYNGIGASEQALGFVKLARAASFSSTGLDFEGAYALNALGRYDEALALLKEASQRWPQDIDIAAKLGYAYTYTRQYELAIKAHTPALSLDKTHTSPRRSELAHNLGVVYQSLGDTKHKEEWLKRAAEWAEKK